MAWFSRKQKGINTPTQEKLEAPDGLWHKCSNCKALQLTENFQKNHYVCLECGYHERIGSREYFDLLFDEGQFDEFNVSLISSDPLEFADKEPYPAKIDRAQKKTGLQDAVRTAKGKVGGKDLVIACMDFSFIGGSMGSVVGEKIARAIDRSLQEQVPFMCISKSGGARMMEAGFSLMQMAKTSAKLAQLEKARIPYLSLLTHPTTGGVTASFAMLGDLNFAEPGALIGFAGPRVIRETIGRDLPQGFQTTEYLVEHGFLDFSIHRRKLKETLTDLLDMLGY